MHSVKFVAVPHCATMGICQIGLVSELGRRESMFIIEDELHSEWQKGQYATFADALSELKRRSAIPWNKAPNLAPCTNWQNCGRNYEIIEFDDTVSPWNELSRTAVLEVRASGIKWLKGPDPGKQ